LRRRTSTAKASGDVVHRRAPRGSGIEPICRELAVVPSSYHDHARRQINSGRRPARARRDDEIKAQIKRVHEASSGLYGSCKVWHQLLRDGVAVARCTVGRVMAAMGIAGVRRGKTTTVSNPKGPCQLDKVNRGFRVERPNALWVVDFTYVHTWAGFVYVAFVIDAYARRIVGWKVSMSATASFVLDALEPAVHARRLGPENGLIYHSDRGVQYLAMNYTQRLAEANLVPLVGSVGDSYHNALAETNNGLYKTELIWRQRSWPSRAYQPWKWRTCAGSTGTTTSASLAQSATSHPPRPRQNTMQPERPSIWLHDSNENASGKPAAVHS
jgi:transposase InsO family protein